MRTGVIYRSDVLSLSAPDLATLSSLHIFRDIDLRTPGEISAAPDMVPAGTLYTNINIFGTPNEPASPPLTSAAGALSAGQSGYRTFVTDPVKRAGFGAVLLTLAHDPGPDLYHCADGKDRTGWTSAVLGSIAGLPQATIMQDYLASNLYLSPVIAARAAPLVAAQPGLAGMNFNLLFGVDPSYLQAALDQVTASYGSMYNYLTQGLGLSQADIYVLRAKMVDYVTLPGQNALSGNAASGASFLNALQNSPLSGHYTAFNFYLQSGVDSGTLGAVPAQVGGQVHADAASYLLRHPQWIADATAPYAGGQDLREGQARAWLAGLGGGFWSNARSGVSGSTDHSAGAIVGATYRLNSKALASLGVGYNWGLVESASARATLNTILVTIGGRYGFETLDSGPYVRASADGAWVDYQSTRDMAGGLGSATGSTNGGVFSGLAGFGWVMPLAPFTITPQVGVRVSDVTLRGFRESGSELGLGVHGIDKASSSLLADLDVSVGSGQLGSWTITPVLTLGYERVLGDPRVTSVGTLYGFAVSQESAWDSRNLFKAGLGFTAQRGAFTLKARANGVGGDGAGSSGMSGQLSLAYSF